MSIENPEMKISFEDGEFLSTPENTVLFNYIAKHALYNHIFIERERTGNVVGGIYVHQATEGYDEMREYMLENGYPAHFNLREVADCDVKAFDNMITRSAQFEDFVPEDWLEGNE